MLSPGGGSAVTGRGAGAEGGSRRCSACPRAAAAPGGAGPGLRSGALTGPARSPLGAACLGPVSPPGRCEAPRAPRPALAPRRPGGEGGGVGPVFAVSFSAPAPALCSVPGDSSRSGQLRPLPALRRGGSARGGGARPSGAWVWPPGLAGCCCGAALWPGLRFTPGETSLPAPRGRLPFWEVKRCWRDPRLLQPKMLLHPGRGNGDQPLPASGASCPLQPRPQAGRGGMWA